MARRNRPVRRQHRPDPRFNDVQVQILINKVMRKGKKSVAEGIVYKAFAEVEERTGKDPVDTFRQAISNTTPMLEVKPRRVGGATYQVPVEIRPERRIALAMRWILEGTRGRSGRNTAEKLANELIDDDEGNLTAIINSSGHNKGPMMEKIIKKYGYQKNQVAAVGDTIVDIPMFERAGLSIAVNTNDERVITKANYHLKGDLSELKKLIINW